jgi:hypothetical protein
MKELRPMKKLFSFIILLMFASFSLPGQVDPLIYNGARKTGQTTFMMATRFAPTFLTMV